MTMIIVFIVILLTSDTTSSVPGTIYLYVGGVEGDPFDLSTLKRWLAPDVVVMLNEGDNLIVF
jgi:hypothetical protein